MCRPGTRVGANDADRGANEGPAYLEQQKRRLPSNKFRRLHLNLPGAPSGAFFDTEMVLKAIVTGLRSLPPNPRNEYAAFVDMSGGSSDEACLAIAHCERDRGNERGRRVHSLTSSRGMFGVVMAERLRGRHLRAWRFPALASRLPAGAGIPFGGEVA